MAEEIEPTETDIFQQQQKVITTLEDVIRNKSNQPQQIIYASPAAPAKKAPNYLLYAGIGLAAYLSLKGKIL